MLSVLVFLPLAGALLLLPLSRRRERLLYAVALAAAAASLFLSVVLAVPFFAQRISTAPTVVDQRVTWIPSIGAEYALHLDGISLPLVVLTTFLTLLAILYSAYAREVKPGETTKEYLVLFLVMDTGLLGVFLASDLLLFYLFWEVALVPLYFIIGIWGHEARREAALKFFLYTRAGSLALLLAILALYLETEPHSFALAAIQAAGQDAGSGTLASLALLGFVLGFGVKLPIVPLHNWLPDAHVEAPTPASVILAGVLLKMGGYGFIRIALPVLSQAMARFAVALTIIALLGVIYGAAVAMVQRDFKRLVAFTSVNHMGFVLLGATVATLPVSEADRLAAINGAVLQMVSHGLLTGGMFFLVGMLQERTGTRDLDKLGGAWGTLPLLAVLLSVFAFGSFGLPGMSGFIAEFQVFVASLATYRWAAIILAVGVAISTALYLRALQRILFVGDNDPPEGKRDLGRGDVALLSSLLALIFLIGLVPGPLIAVIQNAAQALLAR